MQRLWQGATQEGLDNTAETGEWRIAGLPLAKTIKLLYFLTHTLQR